MLKSCSYCGRIHKQGDICQKKPKKQYKNKRKCNDFELKYNQFLSSFAWQKAREEVKERDLYLCVMCVAEGRLDGKRQYDPQILEVHHIIPVKEDWDLRLQKNNLITLCKKHHTDAEMGKIRREELRKKIKYPPGVKI